MLDLPKHSGKNDFLPSLNNKYVQVNSQKLKHIDHSQKSAWTIKYSKNSTELRKANNFSQSNELWLKEIVNNEQKYYLPNK